MPKESPKNEEISVEDQIWSDVESKGIYRLPLQIIKNSLELGGGIASRDPAVPEEMLRQIGPFLTELSPESHVGPSRQAIDFLIPDGTPVIAAADGKVIKFEDSNTLWAPDPNYSNFMNFIWIKHDNGEVSRYCHLAPKSIKRKLGHEGARVREGQVIANVGKTGWTDRDHLHFLLTQDQPYFQLPKMYIENPYGVKGLVPKFALNKN